MEGRFDHLKTRHPFESSDDIFQKHIPRARPIIPNPFERTQLIPTPNFIFLKTENQNNSFFNEASSSLFSKKIQPMQNESNFCGRQDSNGLFNEQFFENENSFSESKNQSKILDQSNIAETNSIADSSEVMTSEQQQTIINLHENLNTHIVGIAKTFQEIDQFKNSKKLKTKRDKRRSFSASRRAKNAQSRIDSTSKESELDKKFSNLGKMVFQYEQDRTKINEIFDNFKEKRGISTSSKKGSQHSTERAGPVPGIKYHPGLQYSIKKSQLAKQGRLPNKPKEWHNSVRKELDNIDEMLHEGKINNQN